MNLTRGEIWVCKEPYCKAEDEVKRSAESGCHGNFILRCCCGKEMALKAAENLLEAVPAAKLAKVGAGR